MFEELPFRPELHQYGYAPGNYMSMCRICDTSKINMDKRAWCCLECAERQYSIDCAVDGSRFPLLIEFEDGTTEIVDEPANVPHRAFKVKAVKHS